jgi:hypothetical protein
MASSQMVTQLAELKEVLLKRQSGSGGWPHWLHIDDASTSIAGTAHALAMLRMQGSEADDPAIDSGLRYLAREVKRHTKPGARGEFSRYSAYALWGLTRYPAGLADEEIFEGARFSARWLLRRARSSGGWSVKGEASDSAPVSLPATMAAVHGLDRIPPYVRGKLGAECRQAAADARVAVRDAAQGSRSQRYWRQVDNGPACPGATSLAVLTLAGGGQDDRDLAKLGVNYLVAHHDDWTSSVDLDQQLDQVTWRIMSFSTGLRAVLHPCAERKPSEELRRAVIEHMDSLWSPSVGAWGAEQGVAPSTTGSYAVVAAVRALKNAWPYDPAQELAEEPATRAKRFRQSTRRSRTKVKPRRLIEVNERARQIFVNEQVGSAKRRFPVRWDDSSTSQWPMLLALLRRTKSAAELQSPNQRDSLLSWRELVRYSSDGDVSEGGVKKAISRINSKVKKASEDRRFPTFQRLVEKIVPGNSDLAHYGLEEAEVEFSE